MQSVEQRLRLLRPQMLKNVTEQYDINRIGRQLQFLERGSFHKLNSRPARFGCFVVHVNGIFFASRYLIDEIAITTPNIDDNARGRDKFLKVLADRAPYFRSAGVRAVARCEIAGFHHARNIDRYTCRASKTCQSPLDRY